MTTHADGVQECCPYQDSGAWEFPLSRRDTQERVLLLCDRQVDIANQHADDAEAEKQLLEEENRALRALAGCAGTKCALALATLPQENRSRRALAVEARPAFDGSSGSIAVVKWEGSECVQWLDFLRQDAADTDTSVAATWQCMCLQPGEHVSMLRGRVQDEDAQAESVLVSSRRGSRRSRETEGESDSVHSPRSRPCALWVEIITSKFRLITAGRPSLTNPVPNFSFTSKPGHEIVGVTLSADGHIEDIVEAALP